MDAWRSGERCRRAFGGLADGLRSGLGVIIRQRTGGVRFPELGGQMVKLGRSRCRYGAREVFDEH